MVEKGGESRQGWWRKLEGEKEKKNTRNYKKKKEQKYVICWEKETIEKADKEEKGKYFCLKKWRGWE